MTEWTAQIELDVRLTPRNGEKLAEDWLPALADYHAGLGSSPTGHVVIVITLPAEKLRQATTTAIAVVQDVTGRTATSVRASTSSAFFAAADPEPSTLPRLLGVTEAAEILGVSRQAVLQACEEGRYPATRAGKAWVLLASAVEAKAKAAAAGE